MRSTRFVTTGMAAGLVAGAVLLLASCGGDTASQTPEPNPEISTPAPMPSESAESSDVSEPQPVPAPGVTVGAPATVTNELTAPWSVAFYGEIALVNERDSARILEVDDAGHLREVGTVAQASARGEGGLLGMAVQDDYLYAYFTTDHDNRIERYPLSGDTGSLALGSAEVLLADIPAASYHNGGRLAFGPDGMIYATTGDAGDTGLSQDLDSLAGKILRLTPDGEVPSDNPFDGSYIYSYGHRNPQGIAWAGDGSMFASEFGQNTWDELNIIEPGGNYGWPIVEGIAGDESYIDPVQQWEPSEASPSGIAIVGDSIFIANLRGERLREVPVSAPHSSVNYFVGEYGRLRDVVSTPDGGLWVVTNNTDGRGSPGADDDRILNVAT
ncbi:Glucose/arabinose dehydrogenase, beta-propeller fold [Micrococcales bacterium KH10]|nr:Glucose/arabinose dehydrogenase, beta-propeller fold [Micrococcales bacterium KH10]